MTPTEVKKAHDEIWAVREKIKGFTGIQPCIYHKLESKNILKPWQIVLRADSVYFFTTKDQVNKFLKELK